MHMDKVKAESEIRKLLESIEQDLDNYSARLHQLGVERREILQLFARRLERMEVDIMRQRVNEKAYGKTEE